MNEAPVSYNCYVENPNTGEEGQITIRGASADKWGALYDEVMLRLAARGLVPSKRKGKKATTSEGGTFKCQYLEVKVEKGQKRYGIMGDKSKYPVAVYPEVLKAAGRDPDKLETGHQYPMAGWMAKYEVNKRGYPGKVTELMQE